MVRPRGNTTWFYHGNTMWYNIPWFTMVNHGVPWFTMVYHGKPWYTMVYHTYTTV